MSCTQQGFIDALVDGFNLSKDLMIPKAQDAIPLRAQPSRPVSIIRKLFGVVASIEFYNQLLLKADKIHNIGSKRLLPTKLIPPDLAEAKMSPECFLSLR